MNSLCGAAGAMASAHAPAIHILSTQMLEIATSFPHQCFVDERRLVFTIEDALASFADGDCVHSLRSKLITALRARWTAIPFQAMLRARGISVDR